MQTSETSVLVVGGGAAGTMLTLELARHGIDALTIDRLPKPATTSKAITIHARTAEIFDSIDARLIGQYLKSGIKNKGYVLHFVENNKRSEVRPGIDFTTIQSKYPFILVHGQSDTERVLRNYVEEEFGRTTQWGTECIDVRHTDDGVAATLRDSNGELQEVRCRYLVACDGMNSTVRQTLKLAQDESDYAGAKMQNMDVFLNGFTDADDYVHYCAGTDHFIMIVKLPGGYYRLLLSDRGEAADPNIKPEKAFMNLVDQHFDGVSLGKVVWHSKWESWARLAQTYRDKNVFLAGDAAHVHSTTGGQGLNCCLQDAHNLGWKLGLVLNGLARPELLDTYETERRPIAEQVIWAASSLHEIFMGHGKNISERAAKIADPAFLDAVVGRCSGISYTYRDCPLQQSTPQPESGPKNGDRVINVEFGDGRSMFELLRHARYSLLGVYAGETGSSELLGNMESIHRDFSAAVETKAVPSSAEFRHHYGDQSDEQLILIRPDGHIAYRCAPKDFAGLQSHLAHALLT